MKLDKIKFARLIAYLGPKMGLGLSEIEDIDNLIDIEVEPEKVSVVAYTDGNVINDMFNCMISGKKIEAIKYYRQLTGRGLLEAKNAVEIITGRLP